MGTKKDIKKIKRELKRLGKSDAEQKEFIETSDEAVRKRILKNYELFKEEHQWKPDAPIEPDDPNEPEPEPEPEEPVPVPEPEPVPEEPTPEPATGVLWDSNRDGKWNNGIKRTVEDSEGSIKPDGKGVECRASGNPKLVIDGDGVAHLVTGSGECEDLSLKLRSRHNEDGDCAERFGGFGCSVDRKSIGMKTESCHNNHENSKSASHGLSIKNNEWHKVRFECKDGDNAVNFECFIDGDSKLKHSHKNPAPAYVDKAKFAQNSYLWIRSNNSDHGRIYVYATNYDSALELEFKFDGGNSIGLRNVQLIAI